MNAGGIKKNSSVVYYRVFYILAFLCGAAFLFLRAKFGFSFQDEPFCLTLAQRLSFGDKLIVDEWNTAQNIGVLLLPFYKIYHAIVGSNTGILLCFRYIYCVLWSGVCALVLFAFRKSGRASIAVFLYLIFFTPLDCMILSYTTIGTMASLLLSTLIYYNFGVKRLPMFLFSFLFSLLFVVSVLCYPFTALFYALFVVGVIIYAVVCKLKKVKCDSYIIKSALISILIVMAAAAAYLLIFVAGSPLNRILDSLKYIFGSQEFLSDSPLLLYMKKVYQLIRAFFHASSCLTVYSVVMLAMCFWLKKRYVLKSMLFCLAGVAFVYDTVTMVREYVSYMMTDFSFIFVLNTQMLPFFLFGFCTFLLLEKKPWLLFFSFTGFASVMAVLYFFQSNTGLVVVSMALAVGGIAGIFYIVMLVDELKAKISKTFVKKSLTVFACVIFIIQFSFEFGTRVTRQYLDLPLPKLTQKISCGAAKGLYTTAENKDDYEKTYKAIQSLTEKYKADKSMSILSYYFSPILYLDTDLPIASYSSWTYPGFESVDAEAVKKRFNDYFSVNPEKAPDIILYRKGEYFYDLDAIDLKEYDKYEEDFGIYVKKAEFR